MPTKKERRALRRQREELLRYHRRSKLRVFALVAAGVLILGGTFSGGWFLGARSPLPESENVSVVSPNFYLPEVDRISVEALKTKLDAGANLVVIDSRSESKYDESHIAGAIAIPEGTMAEPYSDLDGYDEIVTYCD
jgi:hypothetical protein